jgi:hypothetical protein
VKQNLFQDCNIPGEANLLAIVDTKETIHAALKVQVVVALFCHGDDQFPALRRNSLTSLYSSHR